jgi:hypothetical protein
LAKRGLAFSRFQEAHKGAPTKRAGTPSTVI